MTYLTQANGAKIAGMLQVRQKRAQAIAAMHFGVPQSAVSDFAGLFRKKV